MADTSDTREAQTFSKKLADGTKLTRQVTTASGEVEARYDGFWPDKAAGKPSATTSTKGSSPS